MFDIAPSELLLVAIVALVVIGPKDLPRAMRVVGRWVGRARGMARHFRAGFDEMARQAELEEMEKRWAAENERIMREHPNPAPDEEAKDAHFATGLLPTADAEREHAEPSHDEATQEEAIAASDQPMLPLGAPTAATEAAAAPGPARNPDEDRP